MDVGLFGPERLQWATGGTVQFLPVYVFHTGTMQPAILYGEVGADFTAANPVWTDQNGEITFFAEAGTYDLWANDTLVATVSTTSVPEGETITQADLDAATFFHHSQPLAVNPWVINYPMKYKPSVRVIESTGDTLGGFGREDPFLGRIILYFNSALSGDAWLS